jgi:hypothetical protein
MFARWRRDGDSDALEMAGHGSGAQRAAGDRLAALPNATHTYREAIITVLDSRHIEYLDVQVGARCQPDPGYCFATDFRQSYATVVVYVDQTAYGYIQCQDNSADCNLSLPYSEPLSDLAGVRPYRAPSHASSRIASMAARPTAASTAAMICSWALFENGEALPQTWQTDYLTNTLAHWQRVGDCACAYTRCNSSI